MSQINKVGHTPTDHEYDKDNDYHGLNNRTLYGDLTNFSYSNWIYSIESSVTLIDCYGSFSCSYKEIKVGEMDCIEGFSCFNVLFGNESSQIGCYLFASCMNAYILNGRSILECNIKSINNDKINLNTDSNDAVVIVLLDAFLISHGYLQFEVTSSYDDNYSSNHKNSTTTAIINLLCTLQQYINILILSILLMKF